MLFFYQDWALGLLGLKLWSRAVVGGGAWGLGRAPPPGQAAPPAAPGSWRGRLEELARTPWRRLRLQWTLGAVIWPLLEVGLAYILAAAVLCPMESSQWLA